ncbi:uncharacterized protein METZ01_LOCUS13266 [marine metagenome]|uniref:Uncharacterized protein n=1 Tax=marine metagenome TaxID=408172 RepID=A0A381P0J5_9ZZZZ
MNEIHTRLKLFREKFTRNNNLERVIKGTKNLQTLL